MFARLDPLGTPLALSSPPSGRIEGRLATIYALLAAGLLGCSLSAPAPTPQLPGSLVGAFAFQGALLLPGQVAPGVDTPVTSCLVTPDGGLLNPTQTLSFYAYLSEDVDAGAVYWQLVSNGIFFSSQCPACGPVETGTLGPWGFQVDTASCAPVASCGCVGAVNETLALWQILPDGGVDRGLQTPVLSLAGWIDDRLDAAAPPGCLDGGAAACSVAEGLACGLNCDLVYTLTAIPGSPPY